MLRFANIAILICLLLISGQRLRAQSNNCSGAIPVCNNQLAEQLDDGVGTQECPTGGCGCMLAGEKNTRWFKITIQTGGTLEFTIRPYNGTADYDFSIWNRGPAGTCPSGAALGNPDRCNFAAPQLPTGIRGTTNGNSNNASGNQYSNNMTVAAGDVIYLLIDNYDGTTEGFYLDFFGGAPGSGTGTTATFSCSSVNQCTSCTDADCKTWRFDSPGDYSFDETAANGGCHSNFAYASVQTATVCGTFTVPAPYTSVEFPKDRGYEITTTNGASTTTCLNSASISYQVWGVCGTPLTPTPANSGIYTGLDNNTTYKVCKTVSVSGANCYLSRICLPYWTFVNNDNICSATPLTVNAAPVNGTNAGATTSFDAGCTSYREVWYSFVAPASGRIQVNVDPNASSDVKINIVGAMAGLDEGVNDCNLNCSTFDEDNTMMACVDDRGTDGIEKLFTFVIPGQTYYVWVSGTWARPTADFTIQVTETITSDANYTPGPQIVGAPDPIPANDQCANAIDLNPMCAYKPGTTVGATAECTDPDPEYVAASTLENDVWFKWTAPANNGNAQVTLEVTGVSCTAGEDGSLGIQFGIFRGSCGSLIPVSSGTTTLTFIPIPGATYYFVVDGNAGAQCSFNIGVKRATITSQSCTAGSYCAGSNLSASFNYTFSGSNPGYRWAYCKSSTFGSPCTINLDDPSTYSVYNPGAGLPNPGCTPATYTFVGYILADNGATTIAPGYPRPQPVSANCVRETNACTFNIYPDIKSLVNVTTTPCSQVVTANASCSPSPVTITGNTNQTASPSTSGTFTAVTVTWNAPYGASAPPACGSYVIQNTYACPGPSGANGCANAQELTFGAAPIASNNVGVAYNAVEDFNEAGYCDNYGYGVWYSFIAPASGNVNINVTNVGSGNDLDAVVYVFEGVDTLLLYDPILGPFPYFDEDDCAPCTEFTNTHSNLITRAYACTDAAFNGGSEFTQLRNLRQGNRYYIMVDGYELGPTSGNFSIDIDDAGPPAFPPTNDACATATDISNIACNEFQTMNIDATSPCDVDPPFPSATTENTVWYIYVPQYTGEYTFSYSDTRGVNCAGYDAPGDNQDWDATAPSVTGAPGIQFNIYQGNTCSALTPLPNAYISSGTFNGEVTVTLTAGQRYYVAVDGFAANECTYKFKVYNRENCCAANLGETNPPNEIILCAGDQFTLGVSGDTLINFGNNAGQNPVIAWQFSSTPPLVIDPFDPLNSGNTYLPGIKDRNCPTSTTNYIEKFTSDVSSELDIGTIEGTLTKNLVVSGFPAGATLQSADSMELCIYFYAENMDNMDISLVGPDGTTVKIADDDCGTRNGAWSVCLKNTSASGSITVNCPANTTPPSTLSGTYTPEGSFSAFVGKPLNGTWQLRFSDNYFDGNGIWYYGSTLKLKYAQTVPKCTYGTEEGDLNIVNNDPFKYGPQVFWLTPVTMIDYNAATGAFTKDTVCYDYGTPVKVTLLEKMTTPTFSATCAGPGDGSNGISMQVISPSGGMPGLALPKENYLGTNTTPVANWDQTKNVGTGGACTPGTGMDAESTISVPGTAFTGAPTLASANDIKVCISTTHTWFNDIDMYLVAPNGACIQLMTDVGPDDQAAFNNVCFVAASGTNISTYTSGNMTNATRAPEGNLATLVGTPLEGNWKLQIFDDAAGDVGTLFDWSLSLTSPSVIANPYSYTYVGSGAASGISFPSPPVTESETSNSFTVADGAAWAVEFTDANGCTSRVGGTYNKPQLGALLMDTAQCDGVTSIPFQPTQTPKKYARYRISLDFDSYPQDVSWVLEDGLGNIVASGGGYAATLGGAVITTGNLDPDLGPYKFTLYDAFEDGFGSGGGTNTSGSSTTNYIKIEELYADGTSTTLFNEIYGFCTPIYCTGPAASVFDNKAVLLGTPGATFVTGFAATAHAGATCSGSPIAGAITLNTDGTGILNTNTTGITPGNTYSVKYTYTDQYGCQTSVCAPIDIFPSLTLNPVVNCAVLPPTISAGATCTGCNATYVAEYSFDGGNTWTTTATSTYNDIYVYGRIRNVLTNEVGCEVSSFKLDNCPPVILPIELVSIAARPVDNTYIEVNWVTASENNVSHFEVERSLDGIHFSYVGQVAAHGNSNIPRTYIYNDRDVNPNIRYYYRVRSVDLDGTFKYTPIVSAILDGIEALGVTGVYPNPANDFTVLGLNAREETQATLTLYNDLGQVMLEQARILPKGNSEWRIETDQLAAGTYFLKLLYNASEITRRLVILE